MTKAKETKAEVQLRNEWVEHSREITEAYLDGQPYDRLRLVNEAGWCLAQSAEAMLEAGKRLLVIREHEPHGEFIEIVEQRLGMSERIARRLMQASAKFLSPRLQGKSKQLAALGKTKLYELMLEDDDDLEALAEGGTINGMTLDDIDTMSSRELRKALREARSDATAKDEVIADKNKKLDDLSAKKKRLKPTTPDEDSKAIRIEAADLCFQAEALIRGQVHESLNAVRAHGEDNGIDVDAWLAGQLDQLDQALLEAREDLGIHRSVHGPEWEGHVEGGGE